MRETDAVEEAVAPEIPPEADAAAVEEAVAPEADTVTAEEAVAPEADKAASTPDFSADDLFVLLPSFEDFAATPPGFKDVITMPLGFSKDKNITQTKPVSVPEPMLTSGSTLMLEPKSMPCPEPKSCLDPKPMSRPQKSDVSGHMQKQKQILKGSQMFKHHCKYISGYGKDTAALKHGSFSLLQIESFPKVFTEFK